MKHLCLLLLFLILKNPAFAQLPPACAVPNPPLGKTCTQACILCNLDDYSSTTTQTIQGQVIPGYCTQVVHSMGYIGFVAGSTDLTIQVDVGTCTQGNSIEMGIFQTDDCQSFNLVSNCNTAMFTGNSYLFSNTEPLVPGCPYFLAFDNNGPAACAFTVTVINGSATAPPVAAPAVPDGPAAVCPGATAVYTIPPVFGACQYRWTAPAGATINGMPSPVTLDHSAGTTVTITWGSQGGQLCVRASNPCSNSPTTCLPVTVAPIPPTDLPHVTICNGESYDWIDGNTYVSSQLLSYTYVTDLGCDSVVRQQLTVRPPIVNSLGILRVCAGECVTVGNNNYCTPGNFSETFTSYLGCDSTVFFTLVVIPVSAQIAPPDTISCLQTTVLLDGSGSTAGVQYAWYNPAGLLISTDSNALAGSGLHTLIVTRMAAGLTCRDTAQVNVPSNQHLPDIMALGDTLNCLQTQGHLTGASSTPGVTFQWTGPNGFLSMQPDTMVTQPGSYSLVVSAPNGCTAQDTAFVIADIQLPTASLAVSDTITCTLDSVRLQANVMPGATQLVWSGPGNFSSPLDTVQVSQPGPYQLIATAPNGCQDTFFLHVHADTIPPAVFSTGGTITCNQSTAILTAQAIPVNSTLRWNGPLNFNATVADTFTSWPGLHTVSAIAPNGCTASDSILVNADTSLPFIAVQGADTLTCLQDSVLLTAQWLPSTAGLAWSGPLNFSSTTSNATIYIPGSYTVTATSTNGCTATATADIPIDTLPPQVNVTGGILTCTQPAFTLVATVLPANSAMQWSGPQNFNSAQLSPPVTAPGIYTLTATSANGCTASAEANVLADASIPQISATGGILTCAQNSVSLSANASPTDASLSWTGPQGFTSSQNNPTVYLAGTYTVTAATANGCSATATTEVLADTLVPGLNVAGGSITCTDTVVMLSADLSPAHATVVWNGPQNFSSGISNPGISIPGSYIATASLPNGCTTQASVFVSADTTSPLLTLSGGTITCDQPNIILTADMSPAGSAVWWAGPQNFSATQPSPVINLPGIYTATATAENGCTNTQFIFVPADTVAPVVAATGGALTCAAPVIQIQAAFSPQNTALHWSGPDQFSSNLPNPQVFLPGIYTVIGTGTNGCTAEAQTVVGMDTVAPQVTATGGLITCTQNQLTLTGTVIPSNSTVLWSGPQNFSSNLLNPQVSAPGAYTLLATAPNGCTGTTTALVTADTDFPQVSIPGDTLTCTQKTVQLIPVISPAGGMTVWTGPQNFYSTLLNPVVNTPGAYSLTVTSSAGCSATASTVVLIDTLAPAVAGTGGAITCAQTEVQLAADVQPAGSLLVWQGPGGFTSGNAAPIVNVPGVYTITASAGNDCTASATVSVSADTVAPQISVGGGVLTCTQTSVQLSAAVFSQNSVLLWNGPSNFSSNLPDPFVTLAGQYTVVATAANGCTASAGTVVIADASLPQISVNSGVITCTQTQVQLLATIVPAPVILAWSGPQNFSATTPGALVSVPGTYTLVATLANGCSSTATATVAADTTRPQIIATGGNLTCQQDTVWLTSLVSPQGSQIQWTGPAGFSSTLYMSPVTQAGDYTVLATAPNGCTATSKTTVDAYNQPNWTLSLGPDLSVEAFDLIFPKPITDLPEAQINQLKWTFPSGIIGSPCDTCWWPWFKMTAPGPLSLQVTDIFGCSQTAIIQIDVQQTGAIYVPNIFSPGSQTGNQIFALYPGPEARVVRIKAFRIYDRWGNLMHERQDVEPIVSGYGWDGRSQGKDCAAGVYVWYAEILFENGRNKILKGDVTLIP